MVTQSSRYCRSMKALPLSLFALSTVLACGAAQEPAPPAPAPTPAPEPPAASAAAVAPAPAPALSPEEKKKEEERKALEADRQKMLGDHEAEVARLTPELRAQAKTLADKDYGSGRAAIEAALAGKHRKPGNAERDTQRHPQATLEFFGFKPNMTVLEYGPGEGWYTELLAPALAKKGKLIVTTTDPAGPVDQRSTLYGLRTKLFLERAPEVYGKVETATIDGKNPDLTIDGKVDLVIVFRGLHGMVNNNVLPQWLGELHAALKPNGVLGIEQHRGQPDADPVASAKKGYLPEKWVIEQVQAAGFKLAGKSELNANPKDTKDHPEGVWTLPPTLRLGDKDKAKYLAIGETDRMTLKFVKVAKPAAAKPAAAPPAAK